MDNQQLPDNQTILSESDTLSLDEIEDIIRQRIAEGRYDLTNKKLYPLEEVIAAFENGTLGDL